jgi:hypothetical protein
MAAAGGSTLFASGQASASKMRQRAEPQGTIDLTTPIGDNGAFGPKRFWISAVVGPKHFLSMFML